MHLLAEPQLLRPSVFEYAVGAPVEIGILSEVVEAPAGSVEAMSDIMPAFIAQATVRTANLDLVRAGAALPRIEREIAVDIPGPLTLSTANV